MHLDFFWMGAAQPSWIPGMDRNSSWIFGSDFSGIPCWIQVGQRTDSLIFGSTISLAGRSIAAGVVGPTAFFWNLPSTGPVMSPAVWILHCQRLARAVLDFFFCCALDFETFISIGLRRLQPTLPKAGGRRSEPLDRCHRPAGRSGET